MGTAEDRHFFPLTSLQIGDLQSYLSRLTLFLATKSNKIFILVDNRPWLIGQDTRPARLWQLMVTKSRLSPFANTRARKERRDIGKGLDFTNSSMSNPIKQKTLYRWFSVIDAALYQKKALIPVKKLKDSFLLNKELHHTLYGFIVFEVEWAHVRGINYVNELQTDTSMALEVKLMKRWEFDSIEQASSCISSWFSGTYHERSLLQEHLDGVSTRGDVFYDAQEDISNPVGASGNVSDEEDDVDKHFFDNSDSVHSSEEIEDTVSSIYTPPPAYGPCKRRKIMKSKMGREFDEVSEGEYSETMSSPRISRSSSSPSSDSECTGSSFEATTYRDVLILFRFNDHDLPFKLKKIIMSDLRLLTLLEYGLPSWVIFLQSYPVFCQIYRPWMCPLARALYVLISIVTVLIGFYDLYKNVPVLKATASRLFGPFFDWIETWEMVSRIKYLGTMLFLHNFEKAVSWFLMVMRATKSLLSILTRPIAGPIMELAEIILPIWNICLATVEWLGSITWIVVGSSCSIIVEILQIIVWPFWLVFSTAWTVATYVIYPVIWVLWGTLTAPFRLVLAIASSVATLFINIYHLIRESWSSISSIFQLASASEATVDAYEASMWRSLWNDLFSQIFRALRSILYGFVAFCATCNRHRLSWKNAEDPYRSIPCISKRNSGGEAGGEKLAID
ncbi:uncharacterized protein [Elaeis guineensis]|uniref:Uncharacterized protein LOC105039090 isoform X2 n=1 Tax=Elaeis guineensis var. tenera TaxID=51953 RepID=A0A6I9QU74_ELAGV|nr:uncharacterized protein LOC105039090 isoform X2 [Elaeis guineensis]